MRLCLTCRYVSPEGAVHCGHCGRTFGARLCPSRHPSPPDAEYCVQCGKANVTDATRCLPLGWCTRALTLLIVLLALRWAFGSAPSLLQGMWNLSDWISLHLLGISLCHMRAVLLQIAAWFVALFLVSYLLPGSVGGHVRALLMRGAGVAARLARSVSLAIFRWLCRIVGGQRKGA
ncbi:hypothetical protein CCAX7_35140 [Capsulimonas corticalis]|uniref:Uncharacterized protein n=1 Tax=Capsulimonas corticalis TaxID=2219043 RepID=A0A402CY44_9BACT|nr:zinc ribbon domain-containing protein [Capsulimonas corticalis]BDI31463.1 hypothetical protein CCAX7_35140 [Capsulimonas corticalis]